VLILFFNYEFILRVLCGLKKSLNLGIRNLFATEVTEVTEGFTVKNQKRKANADLF